MQIDWTTFVLEIINFLALVWLLKRFLYKPVREMLSQRQAGVERTLADSRAIEARAKALQDEYDGRLADWDKEKIKAREQLAADLNLERSKQLQALGKTLAEERARNAAVEAHQRRETEREQEITAMTHAQRFATTLLGRIASPSLEAILVDLFVEDWANLPESQFQGLRHATVVENTGIAITSAFPLSPEQRQRIEAALVARLGPEITVDFSEDEQLLSGIRLSFGPWHLHFNLADELSSFASAPDHAD